MTRPTSSPPLAIADPFATLASAAEAARAAFNPAAERVEMVVPQKMPAAEAWRRLQKNHADWAPHEWQAALWRGGVHLNGRRFLGDIDRPIEVAPGDVLRAYRFRIPTQALPLTPQNMLWHDDDFVVANKPAWLPTQGTRANARVSLEASLNATLGRDDLQALHRLDRETSGVCVFGKPGRGRSHLARLLQEKRVEKIYWAWVRTAADAQMPKHWRVEGAMRRGRSQAHATLTLHPRCEKPGDRWSCTDFEHLPTPSIDSRYRFVMAKPQTGRTHQIRVHLASCGWPLVGDGIYGDSENPMPRLQLHARWFAFRNHDGCLWRFFAPAPSDFLNPGARAHRD